MSSGKDDLRKHLSSLSFTEKIKILEKLRDRSLMLAAGGLRQTSDSENRAANEVKSKAKGKEE
jgi:hypothetical protein